jgi:pyruvate dehydrogenase E1 component alpha subunit
MHTTSDDPSKYRPDEQVQAWEKRDPLPRLRSHLESKGMWDDDRQAALEADIKQEIAEAVKAFEARTDLKPDAPFDHVFGTKHPRLEEQRAEFLENLSREAGDG